MKGATPRGHEPLTPAVLHVLLALADGASHGYAVMRRVEEESGVVMGPGTVYGSLQRLEDGGMVQEAEAAGGEEDGRRRYYELTPAGLEALEKEALRLDRLAALFRSRGVGPAEAPGAGGR